MKPAIAKVKICGVTQLDELRLLDKHRVDYAGIWYGIPEGLYNLDLQTLGALSAAKTDYTKFVLVTLLHDISLLTEALNHGDFAAVQLHGFQTPPLIRRIKRCFGNGLKVFKVLHVQNSECLEESLVSRYIDTGVDVLILDSYQGPENIGSTGQSISQNFLDGFLSRWHVQRQVMIAGGLDEVAIGPIIRRYEPFAIDIDSAARVSGQINDRRLVQIMSAHRAAVATLQKAGVPDCSLLHE